MPTYRFYCPDCEVEYEQWGSIHADIPYRHTCGTDGRQVFTRLTTIRVGKQGEKTKEVDAREARWQKDMPAYKRFRDRGYQPPQIDGCDQLEATAQSTLEINSGGRIKVDEEQARAAKEMAEDIMAGRA